MNPGEISSTEPQHLVGVPKTCPRLDCPNPTIRIVWRGSVKQLQYHCYGCWRKFNYGGVLRSWAKQVSPPNWWLRQHAPDVKEAPKLLQLQSPRRSGPSRKPTHRRPSRRSVANPSSTEDDTTVHAAEPNQKRTRRANVNHAINKEGPAIATSGEDHGTGIGETSALPLIDVVTKFHGLGDEEAHRGPRTQTPPTSDNTTDMMNNLDDLLGEDIDVDGVDTPVWQSFKTPEAHVLWDDEVPDGAGIVSVAADDNVNNPIVQGEGGLTNASSGGVIEPRRLRAMTITFRQFSVPSKTIYYDLQD